MADSGLQDSIWRQKEGRDWSPESRLLGAYLLSGPNANRIGCFAFDLTLAAKETGLSPERTKEILADLEREGFLRIDRACGWIWLPEMLEQNPFRDADEVRQTLPLLAAVPREAVFHADLVRAFRMSADRPGVPRAPEPTWLAGLIGDTRAADLAQRLAGANDRLRQKLPGLPSFDAVRLQPLAQIVINIGDYSKRWIKFLIDIVNARELRILAFLAVLGWILFVVFARIDIRVAGWFFEPPRSFTLGDTWVGRFFDNQVHYAMEWFIPVLVAAFLYGLIRRRPVWGLTPKRFLFIALSIAIGAGLVTNVVLKDSWGRARPSQIAEFGGPKQFTPAFMRSTQCDKNCSFVSGDASLAASFMAFAVIAERNRRRWWLGLGAFTALVGVMRMSRGSHFLSDVVFAVIFTLMVMFVLARLILDGYWRRWPRWRDRAQGAAALPK
jgi:lipid A 4'-phosphatase